MREKKNPGINLGQVRCLHSEPTEKGQKKKQKKKQKNPGINPGQPAEKGRGKNYGYNIIITMVYANIKKLVCNVFSLIVTFL